MDDDLFDSDGLSWLHSERMIDELIDHPSITKQTTTTTKSHLHERFVVFVVVGQDGYIGISASFKSRDWF